jgi:hypothetical protein
MSEPDCAPTVHVAAAVRPAMQAANMPNRGSFDCFSTFAGKRAPLVDGTVMSTDLELSSSHWRHHSGDLTDAAYAMAGVALDAHSDGSSSDHDDLPLLADFLDVNVMSLPSSTTPQWRHRYAGEHAPLLPASDTVVRVARGTRSVSGTRSIAPPAQAAALAMVAARARSQRASAPHGGSFHAANVAASSTLCEPCPLLAAKMTRSPTLPAVPPAVARSAIARPNGGRRSAAWPWTYSQAYVSSPHGPVGRTSDVPP